jgi:hypothetical protein
MNSNAAYKATQKKLTGESAAKALVLRGISIDLSYNLIVDKTGQRRTPELTRPKHKAS